MAKKKAPASKQQNNDKQQLVIFLSIFMAVVFVGGSILLVATGGSGGGNVVGSSASLESQVASLTQKVNSNPSDVDAKEDLGLAYFNLANQYKQTNDPKTNETFGKAIQMFKEVVEKKPSKESYGDLATSYYYTDQVDLAIQTVEKALDIDPNFAPALMNYAIYLGYGKGDYANAIKQLEKVPAGTPQWSQANSMKQEFTNAMNNPQPNPAQP